MNHLKGRHVHVVRFNPGVGSAFGLISWVYLNCIWLTVVHNLGPAFDVQLTMRFRHLPPFPRLTILSCFDSTEAEHLGVWLHSAVLHGGSYEITIDTKE
jgi:hypothetical protein